MYRQGPLELLAMLKEFLRADANFGDARVLFR
jgi:hypothetical protein